MSTAFKLEDPGEGIREAEVLKVLVSEGDQVSEGDSLFEVETDKAAVEVAADFSGTVESIEGEPASGLDWFWGEVVDYLESIGFDKRTPVELPDEVVARTRAKYVEAFGVLTGQKGHRRRDLIGDIAEFSPLDVTYALQEHSVASLPAHRLTATPSTSSPSPRRDCIRTSAEQY